MKKESVPSQRGSRILTSHVRLKYPAPKGLIEQTLPALGGLAGEFPANLRLRVLADLESVRNPTGDGFAFFENPERGSANIETVCWGMHGHRNLVLAIHWRYGIPEPGLAKITNGTAFVWFTLRYWQVLDPEARAALGEVMRELKIP